MTKTQTMKRERELQKSFLFSDISGFTGLQEAELRTFIEEVMKELAKTVRKYTTTVVNTWGDALFLVFDTALEAAGCALDLRDAIRKEEWHRKGIFKNLAMRIALHNAHALILTDPITGRKNAFGRHVNMTARLEPVGIPNEVLVTEEFKKTLDNHDPTAMICDKLGTMQLAKGWGPSTIYLLRRTGDRKLTQAEITKLRPPRNLVDQLMPHAKSLIGGTDATVGEVAAILKHLDDYLLDNGLIRRNWTVHLRYDCKDLSKDSVVIEEYIQWSYELVNLRNTPARYELQLIGSSELESKEKGMSFHRINPDATETQMFTQSSVKKPIKTIGPAFTVRKRMFKLEPLGKYKLELRYTNKWPVHANHPIIHNSFAPRETSFINRFEIDVLVPVKNIGVLFGDKELTRIPGEKGSHYTFNVPSPILRDQAMEILIDFDPLKLVKRERPRPKRRT